MYNIAASVMEKKQNPIQEAVAEMQTSNAMADGYYLFTTATCPNCKIACSVLDKAGVEYSKLLANENAELTTALGVKQAPTLVVVKNGEAQKFTGVSDIKKMLGA